LQLAADDAARLGQSTVTTENILTGMFRFSDRSLATLLGGPDRLPAKLRDRISDRLHPDSDPLLGDGIALDAEADAALQAAVVDADSKRSPETSMLHVWRAVLSQEAGAAVRLLEDIGGDLTSLRERLRVVDR
jgi:ATP-dependent Clp protease ATP-binding subunit ClpA